MTRAEIIAERDRITRQLGREREVLGSRALSAQLAEFACAADWRELGELFAARAAGMEV